MDPTTQPIVFPYTAVQLTDEINLIPDLWGRLAGLGLFEPKPIASTYVEIGFRNGEIYVLQATERGAPGSVQGEKSGHTVVLKVPHFPHEAVIRPSDLQDRYVFGSGRQQLASIETATADTLLDIRQHHALTRDFLSMGAIKGKLIDGANKVLYDWFQVFGITPKVIDFDLSNPATNVQAKCAELVAHIDGNLRGETMAGVHCLVSGEFFADLVAHPMVEKFYLNSIAAQQLLAASRTEGGRLVQSFTFGEVTFEVCRARAGLRDGSSGRFVAAGEGHAFPLGTTKTFRIYDGPPDHVGLANTLGVEVFVSPEVLKHGQGVELKSQSNVLPICARPDLLVTVRA